MELPVVWIPFPVWRGHLENPRGGLAMAAGPLVFRTSAYVAAPMLAVEFLHNLKSDSFIVKLNILRCQVL